MKYKTKEQFIAHKGIRRLGLVEYIKGLEIKGLAKEDVQAELIKNKVGVFILFFNSKTSLFITFLL